MNKNVKIESKKKVKQKVKRYMEIINKSSINVQRHKLFDIYGSKELNLCLNQMEKIMEKLLKLENILQSETKGTTYIELFKEIKEEMYIVMKSFGGSNIDNLLEVCFDEKYIKSVLDTEEKKK